MATTSNEDFLKILEDKKKYNTYKVVILDDNDNEILNTEAVMIDYLDVSPDLDEIIKAGYWGGQIRYNDDYEYDEDDNPIDDDVYDTICIGSYCVVNRGELLYWRVIDMPFDFYEKYRFKEMRVVYGS